MSGPPVTIVENGGFPVTPVDSNAPILESVESGGVPITLTDGAAPFVVRGFGPTPPSYGALDYASGAEDAFTNFSRAYNLESDAAVLGFACYYTGDPVITIEHGGEPLTIIQDQRLDGILSILAAGVGLSIEEANLTIAATGGNLHGGALRINEMVNVDPGLYGWDAGRAARGSALSLPSVTDAQGGVIKVAVGSSVNGYNAPSTLLGADTVWSGYVAAGLEPPGVDFGPDGNWTLGAGWSWDGNTLKHTGPQSVARLNFPNFTGSGTAVGGGADLAVVADGASLGVSVDGTTFRSTGGPYEGPFYAALGTNRISSVSFRATGDVELSGIHAVAGSGLSWAFGSTPAVNGGNIRFSTTASGPAITICGAEILGEDHP